jgi:type I restriction enzyme S subunit
MSFPRYPKYKPSGVEWLGDVPEHWGSGTLRWLSRRYSGGTPDRDNPRYWEEGTIPWLNSGAVNDRLICEPSAMITDAGLAGSSAKWIPRGALVMALAGQGRTKGTIAQLGFHSTCNQSMAAIIPGDELDSRFLFWWLDSNYQNIRNMAGGDLRDGLNLELLGAIPCPIPHLPEQRAIAAFLDRETAKIDGLVAEQQRLIELLKEKRQAVISHAVTKGLDPKAPMKPSGVEWLGDVPAHWTVGVLSRFSERVVVGIAEAATHAYTETGIPILRSTNVRPNLITGEILRIDERFAEERGSKRMSAGDLVTVRTGNPGVTAVVPPELDGSQCFTMLVTTLDRKRADPWFLALWMNADAAVTFFALEGWGSAQQNISVPILKSLPVPLPPLREQRQILDFCRTADGRMGGLIAEAESAIMLLQERRSALISAAVTGQIDVRNAVATEAA